jgi:polysaccharide biosynthesis/export protein
VLRLIVSSFITVSFANYISAAEVNAMDTQPTEQASVAKSRDLGSPTMAISQGAERGYVLGPGDQVSVLDTDLDELGGKPFRIDTGGELNLPLVGRLHAAGLTVGQLETEVANRVRRYVNEPNVVISITEYRSQPVSVLGAVASPGVHQLEGQKTLYEVLALAGGLRPDAGNSVLITRSMSWGKIPLPDAKVDASGKFSVGSVSVKTILSASDPSQNVTICPNDVISVSHADLVYAVGSLNRPGGFPIGQAESLTALQVVSLAQGLLRTAAGDKAKILRTVPKSSERTQISVNLKDLMSGKGEDVQLQPNDILFVPNSGAKSASARSIEAIVTIATGLAVYGKF